MGKTNYQSLKELSSELTEKLDQLSNGQLKLDEIEQLTQQANELYERLVVIRYKAYEGRDSIAEEVENSLESEEDTEVVATEEITESENEPEDDMMMFDFSGTDEKEESQTIQEIAEEIEEEEGDTVNEIQAEKDEFDDKSLNDNYKKEDGSVAKKFQKAAIVDLKEHIGINRKFLYVNDLFKGDGNAYNSAIGQLNSCSSQSEAFEKVNDLKSEQGWDSENPTVIGFIALVERRYS